MNIPDYMEYKKTNDVVFLNKKKLVLNRTLLRDLMSLARERDYIVCYKGYIITDIFKTHIKNGNRMTFIEAMSELIKLTSKVRYELPVLSAIIYSREELKPFILMCDMYQTQSHLFRKLYCKFDITQLDTFKKYCRILESYYKNESEFDYWVDNDRTVSTSLKRVLKGQVNFLPDKIAGMDLF